MKHRSAITGAAFLMATSAIGPGFITQTTLFTQQLLASFGFVILLSVLLDLAAQMNIWRIISVTGKPAQVLANETANGMGHLLTVLIVAGGLVFNIGNIAGCGLGTQILFQLDTSATFPIKGAWLSAGIALFIFWIKEAGLAMDLFAKWMGLVMIVLTAWVVGQSHPPLGQTLYHAVFPDRLNFLAIVTLVGGTVGGYITFAGAHRLLDAGIKGKNQLRQVTQSSVSAILLASLMRILLYLAALGVVMAGSRLDAKNPAASVFEIAAGEVGHTLFGLVLWAAALTSVVGSAYTSVSFLRNFHPWLERNQRLLVTVFILSSTLVFSAVGKPVSVLIMAGAVNGLILPIALAIMLVAANRKNYLPDYRHPKWMSALGWMVVVLMSGMSVYVLLHDLPALWS